MPTYSVSRRSSRQFSRLDGGTDQAAQLAKLLPDYLPVFRPAIETIDGEGRIHRFGNMTLSRLPVLQIANHLLPWPGASAVRSMRRHALEVMVQGGIRPAADRQHARRLNSLQDLTPRKGADRPAAQRERDIDLPHAAQRHRQVDVMDAGVQHAGLVLREVQFRPIRRATGLHGLRTPSGQ